MYNLFQRDYLHLLNEIDIADSIRVIDFQTVIFLSHLSANVSIFYE